MERAYSGGSHSNSVRTNNGGIGKSVVIGPTSLGTLGTVVTYTLTIPTTPITATMYTVRVTDVLDSRLQIEAVSTSGGVGAASGWSGQTVTATFASIVHETQANVIIRARIPHNWPSAAGDANAGDIIPDTASMRHSTAGPVNSNTVNTNVYEPRLLLDKSVASSAGSLSNLDGTAHLTYTLRITNTGTSPAYSIYVTDAVPAGISVTAQYGGDSRSGPVVGPANMTWFSHYLSHLSPNNTLVLTYTAQISQALTSATLTNSVGVLYHSLTDTIPGVRPYTVSDSAAVGTASVTLDKTSAPPVLRVGDIVTYTLVFTVPAGEAGHGRQHGLPSGGYAARRSAVHHQ